MGSIKTEFGPEIRLFQRRSSHGRRGKHHLASSSANMMMRSSDPGLNMLPWANDNIEDDEEDDQNTIRVLISGFGPFRDHVVNASWEAVKLINPDDVILYSKLRNGENSEGEDILTNLPTIKISFCELAVVYNTVHQVVPTLWEKYKPHLTIHVGVSGIAKAITLEQYAHNYGYCSPDIKDCLPMQNQCITGGCEVLESGLNMAKAMRKINATIAAHGSKTATDAPVIPKNVRAEVSHDPGRFLCDFIYYRSLSIDHERTAFIHVPPLGKPYNANELALAISMCISEFIQQLDEKRLLLQK